jgi:DNA-binding NarL/FixJ family response regulator
VLRHAPLWVQVPLLFALVAGSGVLMWLQPGGPGFLGFFFLAAWVAALRVPAPAGATAAGLALVLALAMVRAATAHRPVMGIVLSALGLSVLYLVVVLAQRAREGQRRAERLLEELEHTRAAQVRAAALSERQHLAREMHDVLAHSLSALTLQLEGARLLAASEPPDTGRLVTALDRAHQLAQAGLRDARRAIGALRDDELPGPQRLAGLAREFERDSGVGCRLEVTGAPRELGSQARLAVYRTAPGGAHQRPQARPPRTRRAAPGLRARRHPAHRRGPRPRRRPLGGRRRRRLRHHRDARAGRAARRDADGGAHRHRLPGRAVGAGMSPPATIRVLVADDQRVVREGLVLLLELLGGIEVVGAAADGEQAMALAADLRPDVVLMDLRMPRLDGVAATRRLRERDPGVRVIALTTYDDEHSVMEAVRAGARGYLTKDAGAEEIRQALEAVVRGEAAIDPAVQHHLLDALATGAPATAGTLPDGLTPREAEVLALIAEGLSNAEIAHRLVVSEATVKSHINHLFTKIGVRDRAQAVTYAYRHDLAS